jgi:hypothetical protein
VQSGYGELAANPCCYIPQSIPLADSEFDKKFSKFHELTECNDCLYYVNGDIENFNYPRNKAERMVPDVDHNHPVYVELSIDNKCNAACLSCSDFFSTLWEEQNKKFNIKTADDYPDPQDDQKVVDNLFDKFNFSHLKILNFLGGEPLISKTTPLVLNKLIDLGISQNIQLKFTTNGSTRLTDYQIELLSCFQDVVFSYSLDGVGDRFHYLRYPLKWNKIESVIDHVRENAKIKSSFFISVTVSPLNAFYVDELEDWANGYFKGDPRFKKLSTPPCNGVMSLQSLPPDAVEYLCKKHSDNSYLIKQFKTGRGPSPEFLEHLRLWDQRRSLDWRETFPAAVPFFEKYLET